MGLQVSEMHQQGYALLEIGEKWMECGYIVILQGMFLFEFSFQRVYLEISLFFLRQWHFILVLNKPNNNHA